MRCRNIAESIVLYCFEALCALRCFASTEDACCSVDCSNADQHFARAHGHWRIFHWHDTGQPYCANPEVIQIPSISKIFRGSGNGSKGVLYDVACLSSWKCCMAQNSSLRQETTSEAARALGWSPKLQPQKEFHAKQPSHAKVNMIYMMKLHESTSKVFNIFEGNARQGTTLSPHLEMNMNSPQSIRLNEVHSIQRTTWATICGMQGLLFSQVWLLWSLHRHPGQLCSNLTSLDTSCQRSPLSCASL